MADNEWGFTNDTKEYEEVVKFRDDAVKDGWVAKPTYPKTESIETAASLEKDGFKMMILARTKSGPKWKYEAHIAIWGPDTLCIAPPNAYNMDRIKAGVRTCNRCGKTDTETYRAGFAARVCKECLPAARKKLEYPGWTN